MESKIKSRMIAVTVVMIAVTAIAIWMRKQELNPPPAIEAGAPAVEPVKAQDVNESANADSAVAQPVAGSNETPADPEFGRWLKQEARELDNVNAGGAQKEQEIRKVVAKITPTQSRQLLQTVKNPAAPAGEKILSTYLLVQGGAKTQGELADLIAAPLSESQDFEPHSVEEVKGVREKSLRIMAIDGLFSQAQREPSARTALAKAAEATTDPTIRAYAEDKLRQLQ